MMVLGAAVVVTATPATASPGCLNGCGWFYKNCILTLSMDSAGCKADCRANPVQGCTRDCSTASHNTRLACSAAKKSCVATCKPLDATCTFPCGEDAAACLAPGKDIRSSCYPACKEAWATAYHACADDACKATAWTDLGNCDRGCGDQIEGLGCEGPFDSCVDACTP